MIDVQRNEDEIKTGFCDECGFDKGLCQCNKTLTKDKRSKKKYIPPTKFCVLPAFDDWELNGKPVSSREAKYGLKEGVFLKKTEIAKNLKDYCGFFNEE